ncbi:hypothetical protein GBAR_LOCUS21745 [Geodia barretti]|uniref:Uncharacterized protein n=1 Tax=Geodia barretti TaxID=519541 RepID=A0AA35X620_GEOBA|nr:hypothetical protein GBAR_LOCUS21745 [Geodia barretti]
MCGSIAPVSYVDLLDIGERRNKTLLRSYCFQCGCQRCLTEMDLDSPFATLCASVEGSLAASVSEAVEKGARSLEKMEDLRRKGGLYYSVLTSLWVCVCVWVCVGVCVCLKEES